MKIKSKYKFGVYKNGKPFFGKIILEIESTSNSKEHQIIEDYEGKGFQNQGYNSWRIGIKNGINYSLKMLEGEEKFKVTILEGGGLTTDTNPIILAYVASRAILDKMKNKEPKSRKDELEELVFSSWNYKLDSQINFEDFTIHKR